MGLASLLTGALEPHSRLENWPFLWKSEPTSVRLLGKGEEKIFAVQTEQALVGEVARFRNTQAGAEGASLARCPVSGDVEICFLANALLSCLVLTRCPASGGCGWPHTGVCPPRGWMGTLRGLRAIQWLWAAGSRCLTSVFSFLSHVYSVEFY